MAILLLPILITLLANSKNRNIKGRNLIVLFLFLQLATIWVNVAFGPLSAGYAINILFRGFDAYLLYMLFAKYWTGREKVYQFFTVVWLSILVVNLFSVAVYFSGGYNVSITGGITRFAGLYNSAAGPAYNGVFALIFAVVITGMSNKSIGLSPLRYEKILFIVTIAASLFLVFTSVTKSAVLMLAIFSIMWWGVHKRQFYFLIPAFILVGYSVFGEGSVFQQRFGNEIEVFVAGNYSDEALAALGTGRYSTWLRVLEAFREFSPMEKMFGVGRSYGAHNNYLAYLMMFGFAGLTTFFLILVTFYTSISRQYRKLRLPEFMLAKTLLVIFMAQAMTGHPFLWSTSLWYLMIAMSLVNVKVGGPAFVNRNLPSG